MNAEKIKMCRQHWNTLSPILKESATAKHLIAAVELAEWLLVKNNALEMECRHLRVLEDQRRRDAEVLRWAGMQQGIVFSVEMQLNAIADRIERGDLTVPHGEKP